MAKEAFNGIDPQDVRRSYRYEQGFTFELNLSGVSGRLRESFGRPGSGQSGSGQPGSAQPGPEPPAGKD
jgi:enoyl-CoA hydratase